MEYKHTVLVEPDWRIEMNKKLAEIQANGNGHQENKYDSLYVSISDLANLPKPEPLIEGVLHQHTLAILSGRDQSFKSFVALDWALCVANGMEWQFNTSTQGKVLYIAGEGVYGMPARIRAWEEHKGVKIDEGNFTLRRQALNMFKPGEAFQDLLERCEREKYALVVFDTLRRISGRANSNTDDMGVVIDHVDAVKRACEGTALMLAHTDKADLDTRGFSGIEDDVDTVWHSRRHGNSKNFLLSNTKMKDGAESEKMELSVKELAGSIVIEEVMEHVASQQEELKESEKKVYDALKEHHDPAGTTYTELEQITGLARPTLKKALKTLRDMGKVMNLNKDSGKGQLMRVVVTPQGNVSGQSEGLEGLLSDPSSPYAD